MAKPSAVAPPLVALLGWVLPGAGYWLLGQRSRALLCGITILLLYLMGLLIGGIRVIDVPGYNNLGQRVMLEPRGRSIEKVPEDTGNVNNPNRRWTLAAQPFAEIANKPWFIPQTLMGPINFLAAKGSLLAARPAEERGRQSRVPASHARVFEIGTLYTAIAGMLNLLVIIDSTARSADTPAPKPGGPALPRQGENQP